MSKFLGFICLIGMASCGSLSTTPWPDIGYGDAASAASDTANTELTAGGDSLIVGTNSDVGATAPTASWLLPADNAVVGLAQPVTFEAQVSSPYLAPVDLFFNVTLTTGPVPDKPQLKADASGKLLFVLNLLPAGPQTVVLQVMDGANPATAITLDLYVDSPPGTPLVLVNPPTPTSADDLQAMVVKAASDVDLGESTTQTYGYEWLLDGLPSPVTASTVPAALTEPGQTWTARVRAWDGYDWGPPGQSSVIISNQPPVPPQIVIDPPNPTVGSTVSCNMAVPATDVDGQNLSYQVAWTLNNQPFLAANGQATLQLATSNAKGFKAAFDVKVGDILGCSIQVSDGIAVTAPVAASSVTLGEFDGCGTGQVPCSLFADCSNTTTAVSTCTCKGGYAGDGYNCADIDECQDSPCNLGADCTNTTGSYTCTCQGGYKQLSDGATVTCNDIDECAMNVYSCDLHADCTNTVGSYDCVCQPGWSGDGSNCTDIDQCLLGILLCDAHATCTNLPGSDTCTCDKGWTGDGSQCQDIDECADPTPTCSTDATCSNTLGGFDCTCKPGFLGDGMSCSDIDECVEETFTCAIEASCVNVPGNYQCACGVGFVGDGKLCDDIDECAIGTATCDPAAACINTPGSYSCACKPGWTGDGKSCVVTQ